MGIILVSETTGSNYNSISNNTIENCTMGIGAFGNEDIVASYNEITDNTLTSLGEANSPFAVGISIENQLNIAISDNTIDGLQGNDDSYVVGIGAENSVSAISGNTITNINGGGCIGLNLSEGSYSVYENDIENLSAISMAVGVMTYSGTVDVSENYFENLSSDNMVAGIASEYSDLYAYDNYLYNFIGTGIMGITATGEDNEIEIVNDTLESFVAEEIIFGIKLEGNNSSFDVSSNTLTTFSSVTDDCMIVGIFSDDEDEDIASDFSIHNNKIYDFEISASSGLISAIYNTHKGNFIAYNNLIYQLYNSNFNSDDGFSIAAIIIGKGTNSLVYNTVVLDDEPLYEENFNTVLFYNAVPASLLNMQNNIFVNNTETTNDNLAVAFINGNDNFNFLSPTTNNNLYFVGTEGGSANELIYMNFSGSSAQSLAEYQALLGDSREDVSITEDPVFVGVDNFNISPEVATGIESGGIEISSPFEITTDLENKARFGGLDYNAGGTAPDIGAYEKYEPIIATNDANNVLTTTATLNGTILPNSIEISDIIFEYGTESGNYSNTTITTPGSVSGNELVNLTADITDLEMLTTYYFRIKSTIGENEYFGEEFEFTTGEVSINGLDNSQINIYPNPTTGIINITSNSKLQNLKTSKIIITDVTGKTIYTSDYQSQIDLSNNEKGIYFIKIKTSDKTIVDKIILN